MLKKALQIIDKIIPFDEVKAHCDIPCGIYDPHLAQLACHTIIRMNQLINELGNDTSREARHKFVRYIQIKEEHAELVKKEIRIIWGDFIKPEHLEKFPQLHELVYKIMKLGSLNKQEISLEHSQELLTKVQEFSEIFWKIKGVESRRIKAPYPSGGELIAVK